MTCAPRNRNYGGTNYFARCILLLIGCQLAMACLDRSLTACQTQLQEEAAADASDPFSVPEDGGAAEENTDPAATDSESEGDEKKDEKNKTVFDMFPAVLPMPAEDAGDASWHAYWMSRSLEQWRAVYLDEQNTFLEDTDEAEALEELDSYFSRMCYSKHEEQAYELFLLLPDATAKELDSFHDSLFECLSRNKRHERGLEILNVPVDEYEKRFSQNIHASYLDLVGNASEEVREEVRRIALERMQVELPFDIDGEKTGPQAIRETLICQTALKLAETEFEAAFKLALSELTGEHLDEFLYPAFRMQWQQGNFQQIISHTDKFSDTAYSVLSDSLTENSIGDLKDYMLCVQAYDCLYQSRRSNLLRRAASMSVDYTEDSGCLFASPKSLPLLLKKLRRSDVHPDEGFYELSPVEQVWAVTCLLDDPTLDLALHYERLMIEAAGGQADEKQTNAAKKQAERTEAETTEHRLRFYLALSQRIGGLVNMNRHRRAEQVVDRIVDPSGAFYCKVIMLEAMFRQAVSLHDTTAIREVRDRLRQLAADPLRSELRSQLFTYRRELLTDFSETIIHQQDRLDQIRESYESAGEDGLDLLRNFISQLVRTELDLGMEMQARITIEQLPEETDRIQQTLLQLMHQDRIGSIPETLQSFKLTEKQEREHLTTLVERAISNTDIRAYRLMKLALKRFPDFNLELDGDTEWYYNCYSSTTRSMMEDLVRMFPDCVVWQNSLAEFHAEQGDPHLAVEMLRHGIDGKGRPLPADRFHANYFYSVLTSRGCAKEALELVDEFEEEIAEDARNEIRSEAITRIAMQEAGAIATRTVDASDDEVWKIGAFRSLANAVRPRN